MTPFPDQSDGAVAALRPDHLERYGVSLRRWSIGDAEDLQALIGANLDHLRPYMAWIASEPQTLDRRRELIAGWQEAWSAGGDLVVGIRLDGVLVGSAGLHRRLGTDGLEIGYWVDKDHLGRGVATAAARALTDLAFGVPGIDVVQICHDVSNSASARVPEKLGFTRAADRPASSESGTSGTGIQGVWTVGRAEWSERVAGVEETLVATVGGRR